MLPAMLAAAWGLPRRIDRRSTVERLQDGDLFIRSTPDQYSVQHRMRAAGAAYSCFPPSRHDFGLYGQSIAEVTLMDKKTARISQSTPNQAERPIPLEIYPVIDNDLARDNVENDLPTADLEELQ